MEQNVVAALSFSGGVEILNDGHVVRDGTPAALGGDPALMNASWCVAMR